MVKTQSRKTASEKKRKVSSETKKKGVKHNSLLKNSKSYVDLKHYHHSLFLIVFCFSILLIVSNAFVFLYLQNDSILKINSLNNSINSVDDKLDSKVSILNQEILESESNLNDVIQNVKDYSAMERNRIRNETTNSIVTLRDYVDRNNRFLKSDFTTKYTEVQSNVVNLIEKSDELEHQLSNVKVRANDFTDVADDVVPAVVSIQTDDGQGSGVFLTRSGYIVTNAHVLEGAKFAQVIDYKGNIYSIVEAYLYENIDIAFLKVNSENDFVYLDLEDRLDVGEKVIAVGNPLGLSSTVTEGIVSALGREIDNSGVGYIQTDVSINPGNSGGPLVNIQKEIVGINTAKLDEGEGLGFAIPASTVSELFENLLSSKSN